MKTLLQIKKIDSKKIRIGQKSDGGYVFNKIMADKAVAEYCYGVANNIEFELEFAEKYKVPAYLFDHTIKKAPKRIIESPYLMYIPEGIGINVDKCKDFLTHYKELGTEGDVLLKMDVEGAEYDYFNNTDIEKIAAITTGIIIEIHMPLRTEEIYNKAKHMLAELNKYYILTHIHPNNNSGYCRAYKKFDYKLPSLLECTFVNKKYVNSTEDDIDAYPIEGLDYKNMPNKKDTFLTFNYNKRIKALF